MSEDRYIVVTGASRGLGLAVARTLAEQGWCVVAASRTLSDPLHQLIDGSSGRISYRSLDLADFRSHYRFCSELVGDCGPPYGLINNAAIAHDGILGTQHDSEIEAMIGVNVTGTILLTKYLSRAMLRRRQGRIVNVSSIIAGTGFSGLSVYAATKAAMIGFTRSLARELGPANITVNAVAPGYMETEMSADLRESELGKIVRRSALNRLTTVDEVAATIGFLISDAASAITGTVTTVDAGSTA